MISPHLPSPSSAAAKAGDFDLHAPDDADRHQLFKNLTKDQRKRLYATNIAQSQPHSKVELLLQRTTQAHKVRYVDRSPLQEKVERALQAINEHAVVVDVFT